MLGVVGNPGHRLALAVHSWPQFSRRCSRLRRNPSRWARNAQQICRQCFRTSSTQRWSFSVKWSVVLYSLRIQDIQPYIYMHINIYIYVYNHVCGYVIFWPKPQVTSCDISFRKMCPVVVFKPWLIRSSFGWLAGLLQEFWITGWCPPMWYWICWFYKPPSTIDNYSYISHKHHKHS